MLLEEREKLVKLIKEFDYWLSEDDRECTVSLTDMISNIEILKVAKEQNSPEPIYTSFSDSLLDEFVETLDLWIKWLNNRSNE